MHRSVALLNRLSITLILLVSVTGGSWSQTRETIVLPINGTEIVKLARPADTVLNGDPEVAHVTPSSTADRKALFLTGGKKPGTTQLIALDAEGVEICRLLVHVVGPIGPIISIITVIKGGKKEYIEIVSSPPSNSFPEGSALPCPLPARPALAISVRGQ
jgi:Flp pilus assembly secretin CpaC